MYVGQLTKINLINFTFSFALSIDDHSRVRLQELPGQPGSDYINGNHMDVSFTQPASILQTPSVGECMGLGSYFILIGLQPTQCLHCNTRYALTAVEPKVAAAHPS